VDWTTTIQDPDELRAAFAGSPDNRYRPLPLWWWSGDPLEEERLLWQVDQLAEMGCGGVEVTGLALHGPSVGSPADVPAGYSDAWLALYRAVCERLRHHGMAMLSWSFLQAGMPVDTLALLAEDSGRRGEQVRTVGGVSVLPFGYDYGSEEAMGALLEPGTTTRRYLDAMEDLLGDVVVGLFEDECPAFPRWAPGFAADFREMKGYEPVMEAFDQDRGPRTPAWRWDLFDVATRRVERAYTKVLGDWVTEHKILAGYDQMNRTGTPLMASAFYLDPFRTMAWANAPGTDQMGDARFALSVAGLTGASRVWLEGFHSHGWGMTLDHQMRLLFEWSREGASLFLPHGIYYGNRALWWDWAPPEMGFRQPYARHYPAFAEAVGRLMTVSAAGHHVPEVAVLYPLSTVWAATEGLLAWGDDARRAERCWIELFGVHNTPSGWEPERAAAPSLLAEAGYDRVAVDDGRLDHFGRLPIVVPACRCLPTATMEALVNAAEGGRAVVVVEPVPDWSAEHGRDDARFLALGARLRAAATVVAEPSEVVAALPPPRVEGGQVQWRRVGSLDVVLAAGGNRLRLRGMAGRRPEIWDVRTGAVAALAAIVDGDDLLVEVPLPAALIALPEGQPEPPLSLDSTGTPRVVELPEVWACEHLAWGENRWGDYRLPGNVGTPPVERRTFAWREGDDPAWRSAPVVPEDVQHPVSDLGFEARMRGATGRPDPAQRWLEEGWREAVSTYGPKAVVEDEVTGTSAPRLVEYSERLGVEDLVLSTTFGLRGFVEPVKVDLGPRGAGTVRSWGHVPAAVDTHLVVEATGVITVQLDGRHLLGPVEAGVVALPVRLDAGWHEVVVVAAERSVAPPPWVGFEGGPRTRVAWAFTEPYQRAPSGIWGGQVFHPDYKGSPLPRRFRRRVVVPERAEVRVTLASTAGATYLSPAVLEPGEHWLEIAAEGAPAAAAVLATVELAMPSGTAWLVSDRWWETTAEGEEGWVGIVEPAASGFMSVTGTEHVQPPPRRNPLLDVAWLEGDDSVVGHVEDGWADVPTPPPPSWFCFQAGPGARRISLPIVGTVEAWVDGERVEPVDGWLPLVEHARVALRVEAPAGRRGAGCFTEHPVLEFGPGTIRTGVSWHRQGLDCYSGVVLHRTTIDVAADDAGPAVLDLGEVAGSVAVRINGIEAGTLVWAPWELPVVLLAGENVVELEVANTLGPMAARGVPTAFGPEDQRASGILARPRWLISGR